MLAAHIFMAQGEDPLTINEKMQMAVENRTTEGQLINGASAVTADIDMKSKNGDNKQKVSLMTLIHENSSPEPRPNPQSCEFYDESIEGQNKRRLFFAYHTIVEQSIHSRQNPNSATKTEAREMIFSMYRNVHDYLSDRDVVLDGLKERLSATELDSLRGFGGRNGNPPIWHVKQKLIRWYESMGINAYGDDFVRLYNETSKRHVSLTSKKRVRVQPSESNDRPKNKSRSSSEGSTISVGECEQPEIDPYGNGFVGVHDVVVHENSNSNSIMGTVHPYIAAACIEISSEDLMREAMCQYPSTDYSTFSYESAIPENGKFN
jgi:hypothetical protein